MADLVCLACGKHHDPGLTEIDGEGQATCTECGGTLHKPKPGEAHLRVELADDVDATRLALLVDRLRRKDDVADVEWLDKPTPDGDSHG